MITGASSGIGEQTATLFAGAEVHLILIARREAKLQAIKKDLMTTGAHVTIMAADLRVDAELNKVTHELLQLERLDVLISNAGLSINRSLEASQDRFHDFTRTMAINYFTPVKLVLELMPLLAKSNGHIINVSTINAILSPLSGWAAYQSSKGAFDTWFRSSEIELNRLGIRTSTAYFPLVRTPMIEPTVSYRNTPAMHAEHAAEIIGSLIIRNKKIYKPWWVLSGQFASVFIRQWGRHGA
ncbi:SDR family NAD(P)-dependent oxidoreductase [Jeotgalibacillus aurantiacus]|uniref:SDR family NAD(P)-dependent oxidoreductase n=1 Tax=Jeotgalibacillus aurantiacus TaxID=2763266 RepID=UPI0029CAB1AB|nr:SDR family NAD(P)-dependent oxidoreductase [Jeotgalibacillus aurantiacus]